MKTKLFFLFLLMHVLSLKTYSIDLQKGYIINQNRDTIFGKIKNQSDIDFNKFLFFYDKEGKETRYLPDEIIAFYLEDDDKLFESKKILSNGDTKEYFLRCLVKGKISFYSLKDYKTDKYFLQKGDELLELKNTPLEREINGVIYNTFKFEYIASLKLEAQNYCPELLSKIDDLKFTQRDLSNYVEKYNYCIDKDQKIGIYQSKSDQGAFRTGINLTIGKSFPQLNNGWSSGLGISEEIRFPGLSRKLFFDLGLKFEYGKCPGDDYENKHDFYNISLPVYLNFDLSSQKLKPFLIAGVQFAANIKGTTSHKTYSWTDKPELIFTLPPTIGAGIEYKASKIFVTVNRLEIKFQAAYYFNRRSAVQYGQKNK